MQVELCFEKLGIPINSTIDEIKHAYRKRLKDLHPDLVSNVKKAHATKQVIELRECYEYLLNNYEKIQAPVKIPSKKQSSLEKESFSKDKKRHLLWRNAQYGMSIEEIKKLFPSSFVPTPDRIHNGYEGSKEYLMLNDEEIMNEYFSVVFCFRNNTLRKVELICEDIQNDFVKCESVRDKFFEALNVRYGKSQKNEIKNFRPSINLVSWNFQWIVGKIKVSLVGKAGCTDRQTVSGLGIYYELSEESYNIIEEVNKL